MRLFQPSQPQIAGRNVQAAAPISTEGVFVLKSVRLFFKKNGLLRFVSHLDMNRVMIRLLRLSKVPVWYTEGFNRHPYITFALPLSLGFSSEYEVMDFRFDDDFEISRAEKMIANVCPKGIEVIALKEPIYKSGKIALADFEVSFSADSKANEESLNSFLTAKSIPVLKTTKKGGTKEIDLSEKIKEFSLKTEDELKLIVRLPAGGEDNVNPKILLDKYMEIIGDIAGFYEINRTGLFLADGTKFE